MIFKEDKDYQYFIKLMCLQAKNYGITIHNYCVMSNYYHLLIETEHENLSKFMRQINMNYAIYFNKKYKRSGHLWQGRYKSWYITDEAHLYTLILYIEQNPLKAKMVENVEACPLQFSTPFPAAATKQPMPKKQLDNSTLPGRYRNDRIIPKYRSRHRTIAGT